MAFKIGQKVECIADSDAPAEVIAAFGCYNVRKGNILVIRRIVEYSGPGLMFEGIKNPITPMWNDEWAYVASRFRPLVDEGTDIELFRHLLSPSSLERLDLLAEQLDVDYKANAG